MNAMAMSACASTSIGPALSLVSRLPSALASGISSADWLAVLPAACDVLRPYQRDLIARTQVAFASGSRRVLVQAPTGSGKTHCIAAVVLAAREAGLRVLVLATRTRIVRQLHERLDDFGVPHGLIAASLPGRSYQAAPVQVASVDTLYRRVLVDRRMPIPGADVVIFDEAHLALGGSRVALLEQYPHAWHLGFTATPAKVSGRPLRERFERLVLGPSVRELINAGCLVRPVVFAAPLASAKELAAIAKDGKTGDYATGEFGELLARPKLVGDVLANWLRIANGKRSLVFAVNKAHGAALVGEFRRAGVAAELLTDETSETDRESAIARLEAGELTVLVNCFLLSYGIDIPSVEAVVLARPTRSVTLYLQAVCRGMRPAPGKDRVMVIDHGRVVESLGFPTADFGWSLDEGGNVNTWARSTMKRRAQGPERPRTCPECAHIWLVSESGRRCESCGWEPAVRAWPVRVVDAELVEMGASRAAASVGREELESFLRECMGYYRGRWPDRWRAREKSGRFWAWSQTCQRFGLGEQRPSSAVWNAAPLNPSSATAGFIKSRLIAWAKRQRDAA